MDDPKGMSLDRVVKISSKISNFCFVTGSQPGSISPEVDSTGFTVQRGRAVPTLTSVHQSQSADHKSDKEQFNKDTKSDELGEEGDSDVFQQVS